MRSSAMIQPAAFFFSRDFAEGLQSSWRSTAGHSLAAMLSAQYVAL
jgi:hypothetical protein